MWEGVLPRWLAPACLEAEPDLKNGWCTQMGRGDDDSYALLCEMLGRVTFTGKLSGPLSRNPGVKIQLLGGSEDMATPPATLEALSAECAGALLKILEGFGHVPSIEVPDLFAEKLLNVIEQAQIFRLVPQ